MNKKLAQIFAKNLMINNKWKSYIKKFDVDAMKKGYFPSATFELTSFCTLKCPMCYIRIDKKRAEALGGRPCTADEWIDLARQFRDQGGIFLLLTGGEAMMRPDFSQIYTAISKMGLYITLFTNGTTIDDKILEVLKKRPPSMVGITIYGASEETYKKFGGKEGSFQKAVNGLDKLLTIPNLAIEVKFTACSENYKDFKAVSELVARRNKVISLDFGTCAPARGASSDARKLRLSKEQIKEINETLEEISRPILDEFSKLSDSIGNTEENGQNDYEAESKSSDLRGMWCKGGKNSVYIAWDGRMYPCDMASYPYAFPLEQGFKEAAYDIRRQVDSLLFPEKCLSCVNKNVICTCIPKAQNEMRDCVKTGERCNYIAE